MLAPSLAIVVLVVSSGVVALGALGWAVARGWVSDEALRKQATSLFDPDDLTVARPWESPTQRAERAEQYGALTEPPPGSFGGAR